MMKEKQTSKKQLTRILSYIFTVVFLAVFLFSGYQIISYLLEGKEESDLNQAMIQEAVVSLQEKPIYAEDVFPMEETSTEEVGSEKHILYLPDISVDIPKLRSEYQGIIGWLYLPETPINYPVMQWKDNDYFVHRLPNGKENAAGSIFMDYRADADLSTGNFILYGHNMKNDSMFGTILDYRDPSYFSEHPYLFYFTENGKHRLEIFAGVHTTSDSYIYTFPQTDDEMRRYISKIRTNSVFKSEVSVSENDRIFILSTCSGSTTDTRRFVICAKLVPIEN